jgi:20S proteasome, alpha and beta subunits
MTLCAATITRDAVLIAADCRLTYSPGNDVSDQLLKIFPLTSRAVLCFAGDVASIKALVESLDLDGLSRQKTANPFSLVKHVARELVHHYRAHRFATVTQFIIASVKGATRVIGKVTLPPKGTPTVIAHAAGRSYVIGDTEATRDHFEKTLAEFPADQFGQHAPFVIASMADSYKSLESLHSGVDRDMLGVSSVMVCVRLTANGIELLNERKEMYRGRIADRNEGLGYALVNEVIMTDNGDVRIVDHQNQKVITLQTIINFEPTRYGILTDHHDPYKLKPIAM